MRAEKDQAEKEAARKAQQMKRALSPVSPEYHDYLLALSQDRNVSPEELQRFAKLIRESPEIAKTAILKALQNVQQKTATFLADKIKEGRLAFTEQAKTYVNLHLQATRAAYAAGEFDVAARHAEWAMEKLGTKNLRLIEMPESEKGGSGAKIMVGVKIGGQQPVVLDNDPDN
jgi:hypothetical protein